MVLVDAYFDWGVIRTDLCFRYDLINDNKTGFGNLMWLVPVIVVRPLLAFCCLLHIKRHGYKQI